jgi:hypothetical protein
MTLLTFSELMAQMTQLARAGDDAPALELLTREAPRFPEHAQRLTYWRMCFAARLGDRALEFVGAT